MAKITLNDVQSIYDLSTLNQDFNNLEAEFQDKVLYRDNPTGEPNQMEQELDMNSNRIINLPKPLTNSEAARLEDIQASLAGGSANLITYENENVETALDKRTIYVGSVAAMEALSLPVGTAVYLTEEGRAGEFVVKAGTPPSDPQKGVYIILANGNYAERDYDGLVKIDWFGAKTSATAAVNTTAIQAAIDFTDIGVYGGKGTYTHNPVTVPVSKNVFVVMGFGQHKTIFQDSGASSNTSFWRFHCTRQFVEGVGIHGNGDGYTSTNGMVGVRIEGSGDGSTAVFFRFKDVRFSNWSSTAFEAFFALDSAIEDFNIFRVGGNGIYLARGNTVEKDSTTCTIGRSYITNVKGSGVHFFAGASMRLQNVITEFCGNVTNGAGYRFESTNGVTLLDCYGEANVRDRNYSDTNPVEIGGIKRGGTEPDIITYSGLAAEDSTGGLRVNGKAVQSRYYRPAVGGQISEVGDEGHPYIEMKPGRSVRLGGLNPMPISVTGQLATASTFETVYTFPADNTNGSINGLMQTRSAYRVLVRIGRDDQPEAFIVGTILNGAFYDVTGIAPTDLQLVDNGTAWEIQLKSERSVDYGRNYVVVLEQLNQNTVDAGI